MAQEIEAKFRIEEPVAVRRRLDDGGARRVGRVFEVNRLFDDAQGRLLAGDCALRLRTCRGLDGDERGVSVTLTYKGPRSAGAVKCREELETPVGDADATATLLERLGFIETIRYEKRRETWKLGGCDVCLDELPRLGWFVEIEGPDAAAIDGVRGRLGFASEDTVVETYPGLAAASGGMLSFDD